MKIAIVGAGLYGLHLARKFSEISEHIDIFESKNDILQCASLVNHYRIHYGFHYLNNPKTIEEIQKSLPQFLIDYDFCIESQFPSYYHIHKDSDISVSEFHEIMNLEDAGPNIHGIYHRIDEIENSQASFCTNEKFLNYDKLHRFFWSFLSVTENVKLHLNRRISCFELDQLKEDYDYVFVCVYDKINSITDSKKKKYKYQLIEKPIIQWNNKPVSHTFVNGDFACIGPHWNKFWFVLGNVKHAVIHEWYNYDHPYGGEYVNRGIIASPEITNFGKFQEDLVKYFPFVQNYNYIGSMYTVKILNNFEGERLFGVDKQDNSFIIYSSKLSTCVLVEQEIKKMIGDL